MNVRDDLGIYWDTGIGQEEADGIEFFGLLNWGKGDLGRSLEEVWQSIHVMTKSRLITAVDYSIRSVSIKVNQWPDEQTWISSVRQTAKLIVGAGAAVCWAGGYDCSWVIDVLDPESNFGNVYAAYSTETGFLCNAGLSDEMVYLNGPQLASLWRVVRQQGNYGVTDD